MQSSGGRSITGCIPNSDLNDPENDSNCCLTPSTMSASASVTTARGRDRREEVRGQTIKIHVFAVGGRGWATEAFHHVDLC